MEAQLIQAMGELSLADKAKARAKKAYGAMTEEQKAERRATQAAAAKAKRAAKKDEPKAEVPAEVAETKKEKDKLRKQKARAAAKGAGAEPEPKPKPKLNYPDPSKPPEGWERLEEGSDWYWVQPSTRALMRPGYAKIGSIYQFYDVRIGERTYTVDLDTGNVYAGKDRMEGSDTVTVGGLVGRWGSGIFVLSNIPEDEQDVEDVRLTFADKTDEWKAAAEKETQKAREEAEKDRLWREELNRRAEAKEQANRDREQKEREAEEARRKLSAELRRREELEWEREAMVREDPLVQRRVAEQFSALYPSLLTIPRTETRRPFVRFPRHAKEVEAIFPYTRIAETDDLGLEQKLTDQAFQTYLNSLTDTEYAARSTKEHAVTFAERLRDDAEARAPPGSLLNSDWGFNPTFRKYFKEIAKEMKQPTPTKETMKEMVAYAQAFPRRKWGEKTLKDHYRAFFSQKSK